MKNWIIIALLLISAAKPVVKTAVKPVIMPKVPMIFLCSGENPLDISTAMMDIYKYMQKNEKEKDSLRTEITYLNLRLDKLMAKE